MATYTQKKRGNEMNTWQMIRELTENPKKAFMRNYDELVVKVDKTGALTWEKGHEHLCVDDEWTENKQPITWQEAIEAWANGKNVKCEINERVFRFQGNGERWISKRSIIEGEWYINE